MKRLALLGCLLLGLAQAQERADPPRDLASLLPEQTLFFVEMDDLGGFERWSKETALGRIWSEPEMQTFMQALWGSVEGAMQRMGGGFSPLAMVGLEPGDFAGIEIRRAGFGLVDLQIAERPRLDAFLVLQFREGAQKAHKIAGALREALGMYTQMTFQPTQVEGLSMHHLPAFGHDFHLLADQDRIVLTTLGERMAQLARALRGENAAPLRASERFRKLEARMGAERHAFLVYADVPRIYVRVMQAAQREGRGRKLQEFQRMWNSLGLDAMEAVGVADIPQGTGFRTELAITLRERRGLFGLVPTGKPNHRFARHAPKGCLLYGAESVDMKAWLDSCMELMTSVDPGLGREMLQLEQELNTMLGVDLRGDLASALGTEWAYYLGAPPQGGLIPDFAIFVSLRDRARAEAALTTLAERMQPLAREERVEMTLRETHFRGAKIRFVELAERYGDPIPIAPAWSVGEDYAVFALYPQTVKHALMEKESLGAKADFQELLREIPDSAVSASYMDVRALTAWLYNGMVPFAQTLQGAINHELRPLGIRLNMEDLPPAEVITRHLGGAMFYTANEPDCLRMGFVSPFGAPMVLAPMAAIGTLGLMWVRVEQDQMRDRIRMAEAQARAEELRARAEATRAREQALQARMQELERQLEELRRLLEERDRR